MRPLINLTLFYCYCYHHNSREFTLALAARRPHKMFFTSALARTQIMFRVRCAHGRADCVYMCCAAAHTHTVSLIAHKYYALTLTSFAPSCPRHPHTIIIIVRHDAVAPDAQYTRTQHRHTTQHLQAPIYSSYARAWARTLHARRVSIFMCGRSRHDDDTRSRARARRVRMDANETMLQRPGDECLAADATVCGMRV